jgi:predicted XRE-type DNA-binding protein
MSKRKNPNRGTAFSDFLKEEGTYEETTALAVKRVLAWQLEQAMEKEKISKNQMAKRMKTSRSQLDRILDPNNPKVQLDTIMKAATVLGRDVRVELV